MTQSMSFKEKLHSDEMTFLLEAHDGLSAKIVEEAGFDGIWASSLSISAAMGIRDTNEASWTQVLETVEFMRDATSIPILVDADTGYGNFNNFRRFVRKMEQRGVTSVCIEDKTFPKMNSFIGEGKDQELAEINNFKTKIRAAKDVAGSDDFTLVARVEAFIAGYGLDEALKRASAYHEAGADAILIHNKESSADKVLDFAKEWDQRCPVVVVPTTYYQTPVSKFEKAGISVVVWANHLLRACIDSMQETANRIYEERSIEGVEEEIPPVEEIFRLQDMEELKKAERKYRTAD